MPLYEYECDACGHRFELIQKFSDPPVEKCPVCGGSVHKMQSAPAIQFKGSGFYITDYARKDQSANAAAASGGSDTKDSGGKEGGKDTNASSKETPAKSASSDKNSSTTDSSKT